MCIRPSTANKERDCSALCNLTSNTLCLSIRNEECQRRARKTVKCLEGKMYKEQLRLLTAAKSFLRRGLEGQCWSLLAADSSRTWENGMKLHQRWIRLGIRTRFFISRVVNTGTGSPQQWSWPQDARTRFSFSVQILVIKGASTETVN